MSRFIGSNVPRQEGPGKVAGTARYVDDIQFDDMLHGATVRSPVPRGTIREIRFEGDLPWDEFVIVRAEDIPGENYVALMEADQPCLADGVINHADEPVLLLAHPDRQLVHKARDLVVIEVDPLPAVLSLDESLTKEQIVWGEDNLIKEYLIDKGDVDAALANAEIIVEGTYRTGAQEQLYIEPQGVIARYDESGLTIWGSMQCPYYVHKAMKVLFGLPDESVRVVWCTTGGGFGGKEEYPSMLSGHAGLLSLKSGKPVKMIYDRHEDIRVTTKRHPSRTRHRTAVAADGTLLAIDVDFVLDAGAYMTLSPVVLSRGAIHAAGPYSCPNVRIRARCVATNNPPYGAFRGFGAPQSLFAAERQMDRIAGRLGMEPLALREKNLLTPGSVTATSQTIHEAVDYAGLLAMALDKSGYTQKRSEFAKHNADPDNTVKKGIGLSTIYHGAGFTGAGEVYLGSVVDVQANEQGEIEILAASTEMGQGQITIFTQIAGDALDLPLKQISVANPDTSRVPNSGPTVASRTSMVVGKLVERACLSLKSKLQDAGLLADDYSSEEFSAACGRYHEQQGALKASAKYEAPPGIVWDEKAYRGEAYGTYAWGVNVAEVAVDTVTYETRVTDFVAVQEIGRVLHPVLAAGQIEGGVAQAIGYAIYEKVVCENGRVQNAQMTNYIMATSMDVPPIRVFFAENPYPYGPGGAKGIGELPFDGPAPAILAAMENATGLDLPEIPILPEDLMEAYSNGGQGV